MEARLEARAKEARIMGDVARELPGKVLSGWVNSTRGVMVRPHLRKAVEDTQVTYVASIMRPLEEYWGGLYKGCPMKGSTLQLILVRRRWRRLEGFIRLEELVAALTRVCKGSLPGEDGLPVAFYLEFPDVYLSSCMYLT